MKICRKPALLFYAPLFISLALCSLLLVSCQNETEDSPAETEQVSVLGDSIFAVVPSSDALVSDMEEGRVPEYANVLYDEMGARPEVDVTDPGVISEIYDGLSKIKIESSNGMGCTDSYHHVYFRLQDGTEVSFGFEGSETLCVGRDRYEVSGGDELWSLVRSLQEAEGEV